MTTAEDRQIVRRACSCAEPDPVMQADMKFYCYACSFETGARPKLLEPEKWLAELAARSERLAAVEEALAFCVSNLKAMYEDTDVLDDRAHAGVSEVWFQLKRRLDSLANNAGGTR